MPVPPSVTSAYNYPLLIKHLLVRSEGTCTGKELVTGLDTGFSYNTLFKRVCQLANSLETSCGHEGMRWCHGLGHKTAILSVSLQFQ